MLPLIPAVIYCITYIITYPVAIRRASGGNYGTLLGRYMRIQLLVLN